MNWITTGAVLCALSILAGAFGAHGLEARLEAASLELWETAAKYLMYSGMGLVLMGLAGAQWARPGFGVAGWCLLVGGMVFSGTVAAIALGAPRWLGAITPIGGVLMVAGFVVFAVAAWQR